jgi:hypothetical protein
MSDTGYEPDDQDQSEVFDEDNLDATETGGVTNEFKTFEEMPDVFDATSAAGDDDDEDFDEDAVDLDEVLGADGVEPEADELFAADSPRLNQIDAESDGLRADDEIELVYDGLLEDVQGAQGSTAHWESRRLGDDDIADLGYGPEGEETER